MNETTPVIIYRGHGHVTTCDGVFHRAEFWNPESHSMVQRIQCLCFCQDPDFIVNGFTTELFSRYQVGGHYTIFHG